MKINIGEKNKGGKFMNDYNKLFKSTSEKAALFCTVHLRHGGGKL